MRLLFRPPFRKYGAFRFISPVMFVSYYHSLCRHDDFDFVALRTLLYPPRSQGGTSLITLAKYL